MKDKKDKSTFDVLSKVDVNKDKKKKVSRGHQRYTLVSDVKKSHEEYEAQAKKEAEKAGK